MKAPDSGPIVRKDAVEDEGMKMRVEIHSPAKALNECHRAALTVGHFVAPRPAA